MYIQITTGYLSRSCLERFDRTRNQTHHDIRYNRNNYQRSDDQDEREFASGNKQTLGLVGRINRLDPRDSHKRGQVGAKSGECYLRFAAK